MRKKVPEILDLQGIVPLYWAEVSERNSRCSPTKFFDLSKGREDPPFRYLVITTDQYSGFDEYYLVCYFDMQGNWITQGGFDSLKDAFDHGGNAFKLGPGHWFDAEKIESDFVD